MFFDFYVSVFDEIFVGYNGRLFSSIDTNDDGQISDSELRALMVGINFDEIDLDQNDAVNKIMKEFDTSGNSRIEKDEFVNGISRWLNKAKLAAARNTVPFSITTFINDYHKVKIVLFHIHIFKSTDAYMNSWKFLHRKQRESMICWMWVGVMKLRVLRNPNRPPSRQCYCCCWEL